MENSFRMEDKNITMVRGDTLSFGMIIADENDHGIQLDTAYFTCRPSYTDPFVFQKSIGQGISMQSTGNYVVRIAPADTHDLEAGKYFYDLQIGLNGDIFTILKGVLEIEQDVTF